MHWNHNELPTTELKVETICDFGSFNTQIHRVNSGNMNQVAVIGYKRKTTRNYQTPTQNSISIDLLHTIRVQQSIKCSTLSQLLFGVA